MSDGKDLAIWAVGAECSTALETAAALERELGITCRVVNARFLKPLDTAALKEDAAAMPLVTIENTLAGTGLDGLADRLLISEKHRGILHFAWPDGETVPHGSGAELRKLAGLTVPQIVRSVREHFFPDAKEQEQS